MSHIAVVIHILEILLGLLHWTEAVTDALTICPAAKPDAQQPAVPATAKHPSPHITAQNHQWMQQHREHSVVCTGSLNTQQRVNPKAVLQAPAPTCLEMGYTERALQGRKVWEREGAAGFAFKLCTGHRPSLLREGRAEHRPRSHGKQRAH